jgi:hypothetical protein
MEPNAYFKSLNLKEIKLNSGVSLAASHNSLISLKETILLASIFFILGTIFIFEGNRIKASITKDDTQLMQLLDNNPTYGSTMIRENILEKYQPIDRNERAKRQSIKNISKLLSAKSELTLLNIEKSKVTANIKTTDTKIAKQVTQSAKAKGFKSSTSGANVKVEKRL